MVENLTVDEWIKNIGITYLKYVPKQDSVVVVDPEDIEYNVDYEQGVVYFNKNMIKKSVMVSYEKLSLGRTSIIEYISKKNK